VLFIDSDHAYEGVKADFPMHGISPSSPKFRPFQWKVKPSSFGLGLWNSIARFDRHLHFARFCYHRPGD
jgi:hypothetical protein